MKFTTIFFIVVFCCFCATSYADMEKQNDRKKRSDSWFYEKISMDSSIFRAFHNVDPKNETTVFPTTRPVPTRRPHPTKYTHPPSTTAYTTPYHSSAYTPTYPHTPEITTYPWYQTSRSWLGKNKLPDEKSQKL
ncbi:hypothetical protein WA026_019769 [Henosepilachna vigintioctopunctata]|uniref:Uncharacterized protein n=1 Tax=Henosepilachna vigintioctopunctata TaxID=420089 RepID=A0AAW1UM19_9CUCU